MTNDEVSAEVRGSDTEDAEGPEGPFSRTECAEHVSFLQGELRKANARAAKANSQLGKARAASYRLRLHTEVALQRALATVEEVTRQLVTNAPRYEDEEDTTS